MSRNDIIWNIIFDTVFVALVIASGFILHSIGRFPSRIDLFDFAILAFATFRLIRLFVYDWTTKYLRDYFASFKSGPGKTLGDLLDCPWCTGVWVAFFASFGYFLSPLAWYPLFILALAGVATYLQLIIIRIGKDL